MQVGDYRRRGQPLGTEFLYYADCLSQFAAKAVSTALAGLRFRSISPARFLCPLVLISLLSFSTFLDAAQEKPLSQATISDLIKNRVSPNRIAQLIQEHGIDFALDERILRRLKQDGADEAVLAALKRMSDRYGEEQQRKRRIAEEEARRRKEAERDRLQQEAAAKAERERQEREVAQRAEKDRQAREAKAKAERERQEQAVKAKAEKDRLDKEAAAKGERERQEKEAAQITRTKQEKVPAQDSEPTKDIKDIRRGILR